jgi:hypothetical protein
MGSAFLVYFFRFSVIIDFKIHLRTITHPASAWAVGRNATSRKPERSATGVESASTPVPFQTGARLALGGTFMGARGIFE